MIVRFVGGSFAAHFFCAMGAAFPGASILDGEAGGTYRRHPGTIPACVPTIGISVVTAPLTTGVFVRL